MQVISREYTSVQALNESKVDNAKLSNIVENRRETKREMKNDAATKRIKVTSVVQRIEDPTLINTVSLAKSECSDVQSSNGFAIRDNGSIAGTICDNESAVVSLQKSMPN